LRACGRLLARDDAEFMVSGGEHQRVLARVHHARCPVSIEPLKLLREWRRGLIPLLQLGEENKKAFRQRGTDDIAPLLAELCSNLLN
jgi:hypothetical protein